AAERIMAQPDWEEQVLLRTNLEKVFLTNDFDDPLEGFDTSRYVPCLRTDDLLFRLHKPDVQERLAKATGVEIGDRKGLDEAIHKLFEGFTAKGARACAISLPPYFPAPRSNFAEEEQIVFDVISQRHGQPAHAALAYVANVVFYKLAENCRDFKLPFD